MSKKIALIPIVCFIFISLISISIARCESFYMYDGGEKLPGDQHVQVIQSPDFGQLVVKFKQKSKIVANSLQSYAKRLFRGCLIIDIVLFAFAVILQRASVEEIFSKFCMMLLFAGFVWAVIINYNEWCDDIVNGFIDISTEIGSPGVNIMTPIEIGIKIFNQISFETAGPVDSVGLIIVGSVVLACFTMMTAQVILVQCESFIVMSAGMLLLGLGGLGITKDYAVSTMRYALSVAFKIFVMQLLLAIGMEFFNDFSIATNGQITMAMLGFYFAIAIIILRLVITIPDQAAGLINGSHVGSGHGMFATAAAVGSATASAIKTTLGGAAKTSKGVEAVYNAVKAGNAQHFQTAGQLSGGFGGAARNMWDAYRASIQNRDDHGRLGQRMSSQLKTAAATGERPQANSMPHSFMSSETNQAGSIGSSGVSGQSATSQTGPAPEVPTVDKQSVRRHASDAAAATQNHENQD